MKIGLTKGGSRLLKLMECRLTTLAGRRALERNRLDALAPSEDDPHAEIHGVLLSDEITFYATECSLLQPFNTKNLKPAGYELTVGDEYFLSGEFQRSEQENIISIPPFEVAVIKTRETLCLPRYMIARWNIRVKHAYKGLLWVGGPQVDPGYKGHLFCPIYNLSDKPVSLERGEPLALIDFVKTTPFNRRKREEEPDNLKRYPRPKRLIIQDYDIDELQSALFTKASQKLVSFEEAIKSFETRFITFTQISFSIFALVLALIVATKLDGKPLSISILIGAATIFLSIYATLVVSFSHIQRKVSHLVTEYYGNVFANGARAAERFLHRKWWLGFCLSMIFALAGATLAYKFFDPLLREVIQQEMVPMADLERVRTELMRRIEVLESKQSIR